MDSEEPIRTMLTNNWRDSTIAAITGQIPNIGGANYHQTTTFCTGQAMITASEILVPQMGKPTNIYELQITAQERLTVPQEIHNNIKIQANKIKKAIQEVIEQHGNDPNRATVVCNTQSIPPLCTEYGKPMEIIAQCTVTYRTEPLGTKQAARARDTLAKLTDSIAFALSTELSKEENYTTAIHIGGKKIKTGTLKEYIQQHYGAEWPQNQK